MAEDGAGGAKKEAPGAKSGGISLQQIATIIGLVAFLLGVQSLSELQHKLFPSPVVPSSSPSVGLTPDREATKWRYVASSDAVCAQAIRALPTTKGGDTSYEWMVAVLAVRRRSLASWQAVPWPVAGVDPVYRAELQKLWSDFDEATRYRNAGQCSAL